MEEDRQGVIEEILKLCSFDNLKDLEVNKTHKNEVRHPNSAYFRKGEIASVEGSIISLKRISLGKF
ncbi:hypothetical protein ACSBR2_030717 [Camellia fascicularis]